MRKSQRIKAFHILSRKRSSAILGCVSTILIFLEIMDRCESALTNTVWHRCPASERKCPVNGKLSSESAVLRKFFGKSFFCPLHLKNETSFSLSSACRLPFISLHSFIYPFIPFVSACFCVLFETSVPHILKNNWSQVITTSTAKSENVKQIKIALHCFFNIR